MPVTVTVFWPTFGAEPDTKITFISAVSFPKHFMKLLGGEQLNGGFLGALDVPFGANCTFAHSWCRPKGQNYFIC